MRSAPVAMSQPVHRVVSSFDMVLVLLGYDAAKPLCADEGPKRPALVVARAHRNRAQRLRRLRTTGEMGNRSQAPSGRSLRNLCAKRRT